MCAFGTSGGTDAQVAVIPHLVTPDHDVLEAAFTRDGVVEPLAERLLNMPSGEWAVTSALLTIARQWLAHRPVGAELLAATPFEGEGTR